PRAHGGLALHPPFGGQRGGDRPHADRVRAGARAAVPGRQGSEKGGVMSATRPDPSRSAAGVPRAASHPDTWTVKVREKAVEALPPEKLLPDGQPTYVASWIYVFGVASIASLILIILSGSILALKGPGWWHETGVGHVFNSIHLWSVELFFFVMVVHLWG